MVDTSLGDLAFFQLPGVKRTAAQAQEQLDRGSKSVFDTALAAAGAYKAGDVVQKADGSGFWLCTTDGVATDPDSATYDGWVDLDRAASSRKYSDGSQLPVGRALCTLAKTSSQVITNNNTTQLNWQTEVSDVLSLHDTGTNTSRITLNNRLPRRSLVSFIASVVFSAPSDQVVAGTREVSILRNGSTVVARATVNANPVGTRSTIVQVRTIRPIRWVQGDYYEVSVFHTKGGDVSVSNDTYMTSFSCFYEGQPQGASAVNGLTFEPALRTQGLASFSQQPNPSRIRIIDDPIFGAGYPALEFWPRNQDNSVTYPRAQVNTPSYIVAGDDVYMGYRIHIPADIADYTGKKSPVLAEIYGPPLSGYGPNVMRIYDNKLTLAPQPLYDPTTGVASGEVATWQFDYAAYKGKSLDLVFRCFMATTAYDASTNTTGGFHELWLDKLDGNGLVQQTLNGGGTRFGIATIRSGVNDGGANYATWKVAWTDLTVGDCKMVFADMRVATSLDEAAPYTYERMQQAGLV